jgi:hypothetical protein
MTIQRNAEAVARAFAANTVRLGSLLYAEISRSLLLLGVCRILGCAAQNAWVRE